MKMKNYFKNFTIVLFLFVFTIPSDLYSQAVKNSGPRFGITVVGPGLLADILNDERDIGDETEVNKS